MNFSNHLLSFRIFADPNNDKLNKTLDYVGYTIG